jgi:hypothetical protein
MAVDGGDDRENERGEVAKEPSIVGPNKATTMLLEMHLKTA